MILGVKWSDALNICVSFTSQLILPIFLRYRPPWRSCTWSSPQVSTSQSPYSHSFWTSSLLACAWSSYRQSCCKRRHLPLPGLSEWVVRKSFQHLICHRWKCNVTHFSCWAMSWCCVHCVTDERKLRLMIPNDTDDDITVMNSNLNVKSFVLFDTPWDRFGLIEHLNTHFK